MIKMELGEQLEYEDLGEQIATFDFSEENSEFNEENLKQGKFILGEAVKETLKDSSIEEMQNKKGSNMNLKMENTANKNFKEYIEICNELDLIPSWISFKKYNEFKSNNNS